MPTLRSYLVDGDGFYILSEPGNPQSRIITDEYIYGITSTKWSRIASSTPCKDGIMSFNIHHKATDDIWHLKINQQKHIGLYPSQDAAIQVLMGLFIKNSGSLESADIAASLQLSLGQSHIDQITP